MSQAQWGHGFHSGLKAAKRNAAEKPLLPRYETTNPNTLDDLFLCVAATIEDSLMQSGAKPGIDYSILDLYKLAQPFVLSRYEAETDDIDITVGWPLQVHDHA